MEHFVSPEDLRGTDLTDSLADGFILADDLKPDTYLAGKGRDILDAVHHIRRDQDIFAGSANQIFPIFKGESQLTLIDVVQFVDDMFVKHCRKAFIPGSDHTAPGDDRTHDVAGNGQLHVIQYAGVAFHDRLLSGQHDVLFRYIEYIEA